MGVENNAEGGDPLSGRSPDAEDGAPSQGTPTKGSSPARRLGGVRRLMGPYVTSVILLVVACATAIGAVAVFPGDGPVAPADSVLQSVLVNGDFVPSEVFVRLEDRHGPMGTLVDVGVASLARHSTHPRVRLEFLRAGHEPICPRCFRLGGNVFDVVASMSNAGPSTVGPATLYGQVAEVFLRGVSYNLASNGVYAAATLPDVAFIRSRSPRLFSGVGTREIIPTQIYLRPDHSTQFSWTGNPPPVVFGGNVTWTFSRPITGTALSATGVSLSGQDAATKSTFIAGALLGIAGGALVGALQEAISATRRRRVARDGEDASRGLAGP